MTSRMTDSCGCAMGATFVVAGLLTGSVYYGWQFHSMKLTLLSAFLRVFIATFLAAGVGKIVGISLHRLKEKHIFKIRLLRF
jgi:hypothetical protein